jgi:hypothetical protein
LTVRLPVTTEDHLSERAVVKGALHPEPVNFLAEGEAHH